MNSKDLDLLEKAFSAEIDAAVNKSPLYMMQTKATKRADALVAGGFLRKASETVNGPLQCTVAGYALTELGRMTYCMSDRCAGAAEGWTEDKGDEVRNAIVSGPPADA